MTFYFSKILWLLINPFNILILSVTLGILLNLFYKKNIYKFFYLFSVILFFLIGIMPTGEFMYYKLENSFHNQTKLPKKIDGILILSGATNPFLTKEHNQISLNDSVERLIESIYLSR